MAAGRRTSKGADCRRRFDYFKLFLRLYIYYRTCNVVYFTNEVQVYEYRAQYRESLRTCILAWHWDAVVKRNSVLCCEQKLRAQPSTHETQVQSDRQMRRAHSTVRAGGNKSKRARLRALVRRGCGGGHALCKFGLRLAQRFEDAARPVEDARGRDALRVVRDKGRGRVRRRVVGAVDAESPRGAAEPA